MKILKFSPTADLSTFLAQFTHVQFSSKWVNFYILVVLKWKYDDFLQFQKLFKWQLIYFPANTQRQKDIVTKLCVGIISHIRKSWPGPCFPLRESMDTVVYIDEQRMPRSDCTDVHYGPIQHSTEIYTGPLSARQGSWRADNRPL